jgi:hypothetical protein
MPAPVSVPEGFNRHLERNVGFLAPPLWLRSPLIGVGSGTGGPLSRGGPVQLEK